MAGGCSKLALLCALALGTVIGSFAALPSIQQSLAIDLIYVLWHNVEDQQIIEDSCFILEPLCPRVVSEHTFPFCQLLPCSKPPNRDPLPVISRIRVGHKITSEISAHSGPKSGRSRNIHTSRLQHVLRARG